MADLPTQGYSYIDPVTGQPAQGLTPPPGVKFRDSALLQSDPNGNLTHTAQGDAFNAFRGYQNENGGTFGGAVRDTGLGTWKPSDANFGVSDGHLALDNKDPAQVAAWKADPAAQANFRLMNGQGTPEDYKTTYGYDPFSGPEADARMVAANAVKAPSVQNADPFGRFDAPTAANRVIKPGDEARMAAQAMQIQQPPVDGGLPTQRTPMQANPTPPQPPTPGLTPFGGDKAKMDAFLAGGAGASVDPVSKTPGASLMSLFGQQPTGDSTIGTRSEGWLHPNGPSPMQAPSDATPDPFAAFTGTPVPPQPTPTVPGATMGGGLPPGTEILPPPVPEGPGFLGGANPEPPLSPSMGAPNDFGGTAAFNVTDGPGIAMPRPGIRPIKPINGAGAPPLRPASGMFPGLKPPQMRPLTPKPAGGAAPAPVPSY